MRQIILDTETTGLEPEQGHRIIEIGCVEVINRRRTGVHYHQYIQPDRKVDEGAMEVHGITDEFLADKPRFADIVDEFMEFVGSDELVIHNAPFDVGFINSELKLDGRDWPKIDSHCAIVDTLYMARQLHPGQRNSLDALCKRYDIDNSKRDLHGALLDAEILADMYLAMTGGQTALLLDEETETVEDDDATGFSVSALTDRVKTNVIKADSHELELHMARLASISKQCGGSSVWERAEKGESS